jgi:hypothetical protein
MAVFTLTAGCNADSLTTASSRMLLFTVLYLNTLYCSPTGLPLIQSHSLYITQILGYHACGVTLFLSLYHSWLPPCRCRLHAGPRPHQQGLACLNFYLSSSCLLTVQAIARKCFLGWYHLHATKKAMCIRLQAGRRHPACHGALSHILHAYRLLHKALSLPCVSHRSAPQQSSAVVFATLFPSSHLTSLPPDRYLHRLCLISVFLFCY